MGRVIGWLSGLAVLLTIVLIGGWFLFAGNKNESTFRTVPVVRGDLLATIGATGTLEPEEVIDVGAQVAGQIMFFGPDPHNPGKIVDYGTQVEEGTLLAQLDDVTYAADVKTARASLDAAKANVQRAEADVNQFKAKFVQADRDWERAKQLGPSNALAQTQFDAYEAAYESAKANVAVGAASLAQAQAAVPQAEAQLTKAERNLAFCTIESPVKGTIIDRRVNIGQTVVASLNAPSLFLIAKDLRRMQVWASVNEADVGNIRAGQAATFTVDAFPGKVFDGVVNKVRLNATMTQNVVTYTVEITFDNSDGKLLPYLTANVQFELARHDGVLLVPNAALRWSPDDEQIAPEFRTDPDAPATQPVRRGAPKEFGNLWVVAADGKLVKPVRVKIGPTDGINTEVSGDGVAENLQVIVGENRITSGNESVTNPFVPRRPQRGPGQGQGGQRR